MTDVVMPQMGESIVEGTLTRWLKKPGDRVERDEPLFEISTDKVDSEIPSPVSGVLKEVLVPEGATVAINSVVARIEDGAGTSAAPPAAEQPAVKPAPETKPDVDVGPSAAVPEARVSPAPEPRQPQPAPAAAGPYPVSPQPQASVTYTPAPSAPPQAEEEQGPLSPLVRKMAREYNIDLSQVKGTGAGGRITKQDLEAYMSSQAARTYAAAAPQPSPAFAQPPSAAAPAPPMPLPEAARVRTAHEQYAAEDRRAHADEQAYFCACDHGASRRYDQNRQLARAGESRISGAKRFFSHISALCHRGHSRSAACLPHLQRLDRWQKHRLLPRYQYRYCRGVRRRSHRSGHSQCR